MSYRGLFSDPGVREKGIVNFATGMVAPNTTNVDISHEIGEKILVAMYSTENLKTFTVKKADLAVQIPKAKEGLPSASTTGKLAKYLQNIDPQLYLQRILILANSNKKVDFAKHELCVVAPSMFDNSGFIRTPKKSDLADFLVSKDCKTDYNTMKQKMQSGEIKVVLDGGALLHRVQWTKGTTFSDIKHNILGHIPPSLVELLSW